jgi:hypothetical protein
MSFIFLDSSGLLRLDFLQMICTENMKNFGAFYKYFLRIVFQSGNVANLHSAKNWFDFLVLL